MLWRPCSILLVQDGCAGGHWRVGLIAASHSNHGESKINPSILDCLCEIILLDEFLWDIRELYAHIFGSLHQGLEVEVFKIKAGKAHIATQHNTVNDEFDKVE